MKAVRRTRAHLRQAALVERFSFRSPRLVHWLSFTVAAACSGGGGTSHRSGVDSAPSDAGHAVEGGHPAIGGAPGRGGPSDSSGGSFGSGVLGDASSAQPGGSANGSSTAGRAG